MSTCVSEHSAQSNTQTVRLQLLKTSISYNNLEKHFHSLGTVFVDDGNRDHEVIGIYKVRLLFKRLVVRLMT